MELTIDDLLRIDGSRPVGLEGLRGKPLKGVSTDTRTLKRGEVYFALRGERFDGHDFLGQALGKGAAVLVVDEQLVKEGSVPGPALSVKETTIALGSLARIFRDKFSRPVLAVGGSNGKTTTKEMAASVLRRKFPVLSTEKNFNNHIGVPLTLFRLSGAHRAAVVETGTNHPGEIARLCEILDPTHGLITNIGREHLEFFRDVKGVAAEEGALFRSVQARKGGIAIVNADDPMVAAAARRNTRRWTYGFRAPRVHVRGEMIEADRLGCWKIGFRDRGAKTMTPVQLRVPGRHTAMNALAAAAVGRCFGVPARKIAEALSSFRAVEDRMQVIRVSGVVILNDTYNANPESMIEALHTLAAMKSAGRKIAVLGDMRELGPRSAAQHEEIGREAGKLGLDYLITTGEQGKRIHEAASGPTRLHYEHKNILAEYLFELLTPGDAVLVKGSRGMRMEDIITFVTDRLSAQKKMAKAEQG